MSLLSLSLEVTRVIAVSETSAAQVGSPLVPHVFLHQTVEHKNKEAWDGKEKTLEDKFYLNLLWENMFSHPSKTSPCKLLKMVNR